MSPEQRSRETLIDHVSGKPGTVLTIYVRDAEEPLSVYISVGAMPIGMIHSWYIGYDGVFRQQGVRLTWADGFVAWLPLKRYVDLGEDSPDAPFKAQVELTGQATWETPT